MSKKHHNRIWIGACGLGVLACLGLVASRVLAQDDAGEEIWQEPVAVVLPWHIMVSPLGAPVDRVCFVRCEDAVTPKLLDPENHLGCYRLPPENRSGEFRGEIRVPTGAGICLRGVSVALSGAISPPSESWYQSCGLSPHRRTCEVRLFWKRFSDWLATPEDERGEPPQQPTSL